MNLTFQGAAYLILLNNVPDLIINLIEPYFPNPQQTAYLLLNLTNRNPQSPSFLLANHRIKRLTLLLVVTAMPSPNITTDSNPS